MTVSGNVSSAGLCYNIDIVVCTELLGGSVSMVSGSLEFLSILAQHSLSFVHSHSMTNMIECF